VVALFLVDTFRRPQAIIGLLGALIAYLVPIGPGLHLFRFSVSSTTPENTGTHLFTFISEGFQQSFWNHHCLFQVQLLEKTKSKYK